MSYVISIQVQPVVRKLVLWKERNSYMVRYEITARKEFYLFVTSSGGFGEVDRRLILVEVDLTDF